MPGQIDDIKARLDIVELVQSYIRLQKAGSNWKALCPFHSEKTPSFNVSPARQIWHCFGCGKGGDHFKFVMEIEGLEFRDALELLAKRAGIELKREDPKLKSERTRLYALVEEAAKIFQSVLHSSKTPERITAPLAYLKKRGPTDETVKAFRLGYAPDSWDFLSRALKNKGYRAEEIERAGLAVKSEQGSYYDRFRNRIIFPISDASGRVVGFSGRMFDQDGKADESLRSIKSQTQTISSPSSVSSSSPTPAKYINTPQTLIYDKSRVLYGFDKAKEAIRKENAVVLVEGQMDVVMSHQAGVKNAVAVSGTALTPQQLQMLKRLTNTIVSSFDRDAAGEAATKRSLDLAAAEGFERKVAMLPADVKDPADAAFQNQGVWQKAVSEAKPIVEFFLETALERHDRTTAAGKRAIAQAVLPEIKRLASEVEKAHWMQTLGRLIEIEESALWRELERTASAASGAPAPREERKVSEPSRRMQLESLLLGTLILHPEQRSLIADVPRHAFLDDQHLRILEVIEAAAQENVREHAALLDVVPSEFREAVNYLAFQAEVMLERIENATERAREILVCMKELEREWVREKLRALSVDISKAEAKGETEQLNTLLDEFNTLAGKIG